MRMVLVLLTSLRSFSSFWHGIARKRSLLVLRASVAIKSTEKSATSSRVFCTFFPQKVPKTPRQMPAPTSSRLTLAPGDYSRVCKQTVPSARAFSPHLFERLFCQAGVVRRETRREKSAFSLAAEKEQPTARVPGAGGCIVLFLLRPLNAGRRLFPRKRHADGFGATFCHQKVAYPPGRMPRLAANRKGGKQHQS